MRPFFEQLQTRISREHLLRFGFSLILATMLWGWVTDQQDPIDTRRFVDVSITIPPLPNTLQVVNELQPAAVSITGPRSIVSDVEARDVGASIDESGIDTPGTYRVEVRADVPDDVRDADAEPSEIEIQVEATASRTFPLERQLPEASNDARSVRSVMPEESQVTVTGPESEVARVVRVLLPIQLGDNTDDFTASFEPYAADAQGQPIVGLEILPQRVSAFVAVQTRGKSVSVVPQTNGAPVEGYSVIQRTVTPQTVVIDGPPELLNDVLFVETEPLDIGGTTDSVVERVSLRGLPSGVTVVDPASGEVEITVVVQEVSVAQELNEQGIQVFGLADGFTARVEPESITVLLDAPRDLLRTMSADDVKVRVDLSGRGPGVYELRPEVTVPRGVTWISNEPQAVRIVVEAAATPGPGPATPAA